MESFHLAAFDEDLVTATLTDLDPRQDDILQIQNSHFVLDRDMDVIAGIALATNLQRARVRTPSIIQFNPAYIRPFEPALVPGNDPNAFDWQRSPLRIKSQEEIIVEAIQNAGVNQRVSVGLLLRQSFQPAPLGDSYWIRWTAATTLTANAWTTLTITLETNLPRGRYAVIGAMVQSTGGKFFQLIFDQQFLRPGGLAQATLGLRPPPWQINGGLGKWGEFTTISIPRVRVFSNAADTAQEGYFQVVPIGAA